jgi:hypothetical protein
MLEKQRCGLLEKNGEKKMGIFEGLKLRNSY